jgi:hypothetical protein
VATVRIVRGIADRADVRRQYRVLIDGAEVGRVGDGQSVEFDVQPGDHTIRLKIDTTGSPELSFSAGEGDTVSFSCYSASATPSGQYGLGHLASLLRVALSKDKAIVLERS